MTSRNVNDVQLYSWYFPERLKDHFSNDRVLISMVIIVRFLIKHVRSFQNEEKKTEYIMCVSKCKIIWLLPLRKMVNLILVILYSVWLYDRKYSEGSQFYV